MTVNHAEFSKQNEAHIYTCSEDGSLWFWDLNSKPFGIEQQLASHNSVIIKEKNQNNKKVSLKKLEQNFLSNFLIAISNAGNFYFIDSLWVKQVQ